MSDKMIVRTISKTSKRFNALSAVSFILSLICIPAVLITNSDFWSALCGGFFGLGLIFILLNLFLRIFSKLEVHEDNVSSLKINSGLSIEEIKKVSDIEYLGNWISLVDGSKYEIQRKKILELSTQFDKGKTLVEPSKFNILNLSPKEQIMGFFYFIASWYS